MKTNILCVNCIWPKVFHGQDFIRFWKYHYVTSLHGILWDRHLRKILYSMWWYNIWKILIFYVMYKCLVQEPLRNKMKSKNTTLSEQFQNLVETETKSTPLNIYTANLLGTNTSMKMMLLCIWVIWVSCVVQRI